MTSQEIFDKVWNWFVVEKHAPSYDTELRCCRYRDPSGNKCAVGVIIPDEKYEKEMENTTLQQLSMQFGFSDNLFLMARLQSAHDDAVHVNKATGESFLDYITKGLTELAHHNKLVVPV